MLANRPEASRGPLLNSLLEMGRDYPDEYGGPEKAFHDDAQITDQRIRKRWSHTEEFTRVKIKYFDNDHKKKKKKKKTGKTTKT